MISPQTARRSRAFLEKMQFSMVMLSDPGNRVAENYGLVYTFPQNLKEVYQQLGVDLARFNGDDSWKLPMPARYIIDRQQQVRYAEVSPDYTVRPDPAHTIEALKKMTS